MALPALLKSPYMMGGLGIGVTGSAAVGIAGTQYFGDYSEANNARLSGFNLKRTDNRVNAENGDCFKSFFPGVADPGMPPSMMTADPNPNNGQFSLPSDSKTQFMVGCKYLDLAKTTDNQVFVFKSETVAKTENFGWSLSATAFNLVSTNGNWSDPVVRFEFRLLFMEKKNEGWSTLGGYFWTGSGKISKSHFAIYGPEGQGDWLRLALSPGGSALKDLLPTKLDDTSHRWEDRKYLGLWDSSDPGKEVFEDIVDGIWAMSGSDDRYLHVPSVRRAYRDGSWKITTIDNLDLNGMYTPFKDKKGKWVSKEVYCKNLSSAGEQSEWDKKEMKAFCASKPTVAK